MSHTLLLADDSVTIRRVIELTFADEQVKVVSVSNGREALDRIAAEPPDIVLADIGMADVSGYEIASFIKGRADLRHIPVVLLAGAFEPLDEVKAREAGSDAVLVKPFEPQMVVARVHELLARPAGAAPAPARPAAPAAASAMRPAPAPAAPPPAAAPAPPASAPAGTPAPATARPQGREGRSMPLDPEPIRAASGSTATDPLFDASLDRLDAAFQDAHGPSMAADVVDDFAKDLKQLRSSRPEGERGDAAFARDEFGDWDLPSRAAPAPPVDDSFAPTFDEPGDALAPRMAEPVAEPPRLIAPVPTRPAPEPPAVTLPPPVTLEPRVEAVRAASVPAAAPSSTAAPAARPATHADVPLADAFSSLLAAEEGRPHQPLAAYVQMPAYDAAPPAASAAPEAGGQIPDEVIDRIVDKVVARLGAGVRGTVLDLAERLVRAEIDRLKALR